MAPINRDKCYMCFNNYTQDDFVTCNQCDVSICSNCCEYNDCVCTGNYNNFRFENDELIDDDDYRSNEELYTRNKDRLCDPFYLIIVISCIILLSFGYLLVHTSEKSEVITPNIFRVRYDDFKPAGEFKHFIILDQSIDNFLIKWS